MSQLCEVYMTLIAAYKRIGRSTEALAVRIDTSHAVGRLSEEEYADLIQAAAQGG